MSNNYDEFQGTDLDSSADFDRDDENDLLPILALSAAVAALVGGLLVLMGRRRAATPMERVEAVLKDPGKAGKREVKALAKAIRNSDLSDLLGEARDRASKAMDDMDVGGSLSDLLHEARHKANRAAHDFDLAGSVGDAVDSVSKRARSATKDMSLSDTLNEALSKVGDAASRVDVGDTAHELRKHVAGMAGDLHDSHVGAGGVEHLLDTLKERLSAAIDSVRDDVAPKAADKLKSDVIPAAQSAMDNISKHMQEDVLPTAQDALGKLRDDVLPKAQERANKLVGDTEVGHKARKAAKSAKESAGPFGDMMRGLGLAVIAKVVDELLPQAKKAGGKAVDMARDDVIPAAAQTAGDAAQRVREDILPRVGDAASQAPDILQGLLKLASDRVEDALNKAQPVAAGALEVGKQKASDAAEFSMHRAGEVASGARVIGGGVGGVVTTAGRGVGGAVSTAGRGVGGAVGFTAHATRELTGILFWLAMMAGLILLVFVPDKDRQKEIINSAMQLMGELREMWRDLQGNNFEELDSGDSEGA
ncbi:MAG: hypothetical protein M3014_07705 [Chloroflexota bacterium]|nr:hypothetical protein [Chloroflexota bacterium]